MSTDKKELPYIQISKPPLKLLIDTGSTKSFLNPEIASKYYYDKISYEPFIVSTIFQTSSHDYCTEIPIFPEFNQNDHLKFYLFNFHNVYDGLIGLDNLKLLHAQLDFVNSKLVTPRCVIPIHYQQSGQQILLNLKIDPHTRTVTKIPVNTKNGDIIIPHQQIQNCEIPESLSTAENGLALVEISNKTDKEITLSLVNPVKTIPFIENNYELYHADVTTPTNNKNLNIDNLIRTAHMNSEEKEQILKLCRKYSDIFHIENQSLSFTNQIKHCIKTKDEIPVYTKSYRYPFVHKPEVERQINSMLEQGIIRPSNSPWSSPIWIVPKKADASGKKKWRIVVDYRKLNEKTIDDRYPLPNITDVLDKLGRCNYFSTLDLASGFHQIEMNPEDISKTAFNVENGHYEYVRMPFGLKNAPATFQRVMDNILRGLQNEICLVYLDDIIIYSTSLQEHLVNLSKIFQRLRETNFKIQLDKSEFLKKEVAYLGHIVTPEGVKPNPDKIAAIEKFPLPKTSKEIKGFLGLLGYYRKFIKDFARITKPLTLCLKKDAKIEHTPQFIKCFEDCKKLLTNEPILQYPDFTKDFILTTDASNVAVGSVLSQGIIGKDKPVAFASRTLNDSEQNFSTIEKELLAIVWATKYFRPYLYGRKFKIVTDHKPLKWLMSLKEPSSRLVRWRLKLEEFDYEVEYKKGKNNTNADALSRIEIHTKDFFQYMDEFNKSITKPQRQEENTDNLSIIGNISDQPIMDDVREEQGPSTQRRATTDTEETISAEEIEEVNPEEGDTIHTSHEDPIQEMPTSERPLNSFDHQIKIKFVLHSPAKPESKQIFPSKKRLYAQISINNLETDIIDLFKNYLDPKFTYAINFDNESHVPQVCEILRKTFKNSAYKLLKCNTILQDITKKDNQIVTIRNYHEGKTNHRGISETETRIRRSYYWPGIKSDVTNYINECEICQTNKYDRNPPKQKLMISPTPSRPFEIVHIDTFQAQGQKFLTIIDTFSKYAQAYPLSGMLGTEIVKAFLIFMTHHGLPSLVVMDNGTELKNSVVQEFFKTHQVQTHYITVNNPQSNGPIERFHSTIIEHLRVIRNKNKGKIDILNQMPYAILGYNNSIHSTTKQKPIDIINGHLNTKDPFDIDINQKLINNYIQEHRDTTKEIYKTLNEKLSQQKEHLIERHNERQDRHDPLTYEPNADAYRKITTKTRNKLNPRFTKEKVTRNKNIKIKTTCNVLHKQNLKRPRSNKKQLLQEPPDPPDPGNADGHTSGNNNNESQQEPGSPPLQTGHSQDKI